MTYTAPAAETTVKADDLAIQDKAGNNAVAFTDKAVTNLVLRTLRKRVAVMCRYTRQFPPSPRDGRISGTADRSEWGQSKLVQRPTEVVSQTFSSTMALIEVTAQASVTNTTLLVTNTTGDTTSPADPVVTLGTTGNGAIGR